MRYEYREIKNKGFMLTEKHIKRAEKLTLDNWKVKQADSYRIILVKELP